MSEATHVTVACVIEADERILLVRESTPEGICYNQPAGHLEAGETLLQAAVRETLEETGWQVRLTGFLGVSQYFAAAAGITYVRVSFTASPVAQVPGAVLDEGILAAEWWRAEEVASLPLRSPLVLRDLERARRGAVLPLEFVDVEHALA